MIVKMQRQIQADSVQSDMTSRQAGRGSASRLERSSRSFVQDQQSL